MLYFASIFITSSDVLVVTFVGVPSVGGQAVQSILVYPGDMAAAGQAIMLHCSALYRVAQSPQQHNNTRQTFSQEIRYELLQKLQEYQTPQNSPFYKKCYLNILGYL